MRAEVLNSQTVSMGSDCIVAIDHSDPKLVRVFEAATGKEIGKSFVQVVHVMSLGEDCDCSLLLSITATRNVFVCSKTL